MRRFMMLCNSAFDLIIESSNERWGSRPISEDGTSKVLIDPRPEKAGWYLRDHSKGNIEGAHHIGADGN
jgi:hypothetical protein